MKSRLFQHVYLERSEKNPVNTSVFECLNGNNVIKARVSDHHPVIHDGVLFWNIMMKGGPRKSSGYNNAFNMTENKKEYLCRLIKVSHVIAEIVYQNPSIETIGLCEGPVKLLHRNVLLQSLKKFPWMERFFIRDVFHKPSLGTWGILMLSDKKYSVCKISWNFDFYGPFSQKHENSIKKLDNRLQIWKLKKEGKEKYFALGHFPFGEDGDAYVTEKTKLSETAIIYSALINNLIHQYANDHFIFCADFNFNPYLINQCQDRILDQITNDNSILSTMEEESGEKTTKTVTVDGILLSPREKQKYYAFRSNPSFFNALIKSSYHQYLEENRHENGRLQNEYDKHFGLVLR